MVIGYYILSSFRCEHLLNHMHVLHTCFVQKGRVFQKTNYQKLETYFIGLTRSLFLHLCVSLDHNSNIIHYNQAHGNFYAMMQWCGIHRCLMCILKLTNLLNATLNNTKRGQWYAICNIHHMFAWPWSTNLLDCHLHLKFLVFLNQLDTVMYEISLKYVRH